jgi:diguanylate cyclase (GGDEF)-like protein
MIAQGETLGLLYLSTSKAHRLNDTKQQLARTVAEQVGMAIANLTLRETLQNQSIRDSLTGLFNRRYLDEFLNQEIHQATRNQYSVGIIMIDIDHFKQFNDTLGHDAGDFVLQEIGKLLKNIIRASDVACRYGGEEMTLILPESSLEDTYLKAEKVREAIAELKLNYEGKNIEGLTASFGVACFPDQGITGNSVIQAADAALYRAKAAGRNQVIVANK